MSKAPLYVTLDRTYSFNTNQSLGAMGLSFGKVYQVFAETYADYTVINDRGQERSTYKSRWLVVVNHRPSTVWRRL